MHVGLVRVHLVGLEDLGDLVQLVLRELEGGVGHVVDGGSRGRPRRGGGGAGAAAHHVRGHVGCLIARGCLLVGVGGTGVVGVAGVVACGCGSGVGLIVSTLLAILKAFYVVGYGVAMALSGVSVRPSSPSSPLRPIAISLATAGVGGEPPGGGGGETQLYPGGG